MTTNESTENPTVSEVAKAEDERCRAVAASDWDAIEGILGDDFTYTHSTGKTEGKADQIAALKSRGRTIEWRERAIRPFGDVAVITGVTDLTLAALPDGSPKKINTLAVTQVWVKKKSNWQLVVNHGAMIESR